MEAICVKKSNKGSQLIEIIIVIVIIGVLATLALPGSQGRSRHPEALRP